MRGLCALSAGDRSQREEELAVQEFYRDKAVLITGVTGFLGKILLEKLLRSCPGIRRIFLLIRPRKGCKSKERLASLLKAECFEHIHREHSDALEKLTAIDGDLTEPGLGLQPDDYELLTREVSVVFHSAATIKFNETLRHAVEMNIEGTRKVLKLCHQMKNLQSVVHVSTAYCNCDCKRLDERIYRPSVHPQNIIACTKWMEESMLAALTPQLLRSKPNTYVLAKFLSESLVAEEGWDLPVAIIRPSIVAASWKEPFPGWVDALNGSTSLLASVSMRDRPKIFPLICLFRAAITVCILHYKLVVCLCPRAEQQQRRRQQTGSDETSETLPSDRPTDEASQQEHQPAVYNCVTGTLNRLVVGDIRRYLCKFLPLYPLQDTFGCPRVDMTSSQLYQSVMVFFRNYLPAVAVDLVRRCTGRRPRMVRFLEQSKSAMEAVRFFTTQTWEFSSNNMVLLHDRLSPFDRQTFDIDIRKIDWESYWENYLLGVRRYLFKQDPSTLPESRKRLKRQHAVHVALKTLLILGFLRILLGRSRLAQQAWRLAIGLLSRLLQLVRFTSHN
ncbi:unnamed protein product [Ixodes hexagonus]